MPKTKNDLKILLLQIRQDEQTKKEEVESFSRYSGIDSGQIDILDVFERPHFLPSVIDGYDALFVGGASAASVLHPEKYPFVRECQKLLQYVAQKNIPTFASCFGFQLAIQAFGGEIVSDPENFEMDTLPITLTAAAKIDPLFCNVSNPFLGISVHQEKALTVPEGCELLAYTDDCVHSFRVQGKKFWAFQFHPELNKQTLLERLIIYQEKYTDGDGHIQEIIENAQETPEANGLLHAFITKVVLSE